MSVFIDDEEEGLVLVLLERFEKQRLPRMLRVKEYVDAGGVLSDADILFLEEIFDDVQHFKPLIDRNVQCQVITTQALHLCHQITEQATENEKQARN